MSALVLLLTCWPAATSGAAEHAPATPGREGATARFLAYSPPPPTPAAVCFVDTGIDTNPDTAGALLHSEAVVPGQAPTGDTDPARKHGTKVLGVAAAPRNDWGTVGIWPQLKAVSINGTRVAAPTFPFDAYRLAIRRCMTLRTTFPIVAVNLSLGSPDVPTPAQLAQLLDAIDAARVNGIHVVASAGNTGAGVETPASLDGVFAVGASEPATGALCSFSARGEGLDVLFPGCGVAIASPSGEPLLADGTTYGSAGLVAVLAALRAYAPTLSVDAAEQLVRESAASHGGVVDARAAFIAAGLSSVVLEGERRAAEVEAATPPDQIPPTQDPPAAQPPSTTVPGSTPPRPPVPSGSSEGRWQRPRAVVARRGQRLTIRLLNRPRGAHTTVVVESRSNEFGWRQRSRRTTGAALVRLTLPRTVRVRRARVRLWYAADLSAAASRPLVIPSSRFRPQ
ncbi:S8/S53 family peptidase [Conexibacter sp. JD483]|uniref:S8 family peptidase n=1 Tax=unclassified Conexibacter TaxID=2627773 RepID=UPI00271E44D8|nr:MULTISPECIES: S8/S53 family peptidase [unclassified Conexibacter]MDO8185868.1 S8/S53 family peptidase [Conexibacter sp. CPCC 205706]MDO8198611.1 S8/S53 family peptidase [Conexibacter sp. CPCC 205762]MDR9367697.1 S8/S53 family peptidase [Conexibacter sp. JD483]